MASTNNQSNLTKKRNAFFNHLSIFRQTCSLNNVRKDSQQYRSQFDVHAEQIFFPISRNYRSMKKPSARPISLDLDFVKDLLNQQQESSITKAFGMTVLFSRFITIYSILKHYVHKKWRDDCVFFLLIRSDDLFLLHIWFTCYICKWNFRTSNIFINSEKSNLYTFVLYRCAWAEFFLQFPLITC